MILMEAENQALWMGLVIYVEGGPKCEQEGCMEYADGLCEHWLLLVEDMVARQWGLWVVG